MRLPCGALPPPAPKSFGFLSRYAVTILSHVTAAGFASTCALTFFSSPFVSSCCCSADKNCIAIASWFRSSSSTLVRIAVCSIPRIFMRWVRSCCFIRGSARISSIAAATREPRFSGATLLMSIPCICSINFRISSAVRFVSLLVSRNRCCASRIASVVAVRCAERRKSRSDFHSLSSCCGGSRSGPPNAARDINVVRRPCSSLYLASVWSSFLPSAAF